VGPKDPTISTIYYDAALTQYKNKGQYYCLKFDRILDAEHQIYVGIGTREKEITTNKSLQVIRLGDYTNKYHRLIDFTETERKLKYEFEDNVKLILKKTEDNDIQLELFDLDNDRFISKTVDPTIIRMFNKISLSSAELDKIHELFSSCKIE
jgi:hypothetical protein